MIYFSHFVLGNTSVDCHGISMIFLMVHFWHVTLHYYAVITVNYYYTVSMHDMGNCNVVESAAKCQGISRAREWSP